MGQYYELGIIGVLGIQSTLNTYYVNIPWSHQSCLYANPVVATTR